MCVYTAVIFVTMETKAATRYTSRRCIPYSALSTIRTFFKAEQSFPPSYPLPVLVHQMGGDIDTDDLAKERLVLSEVHVGSSTQDEEAEVVSRYTFLTPSYHGNNNARDSSSDSEGEKSDDSSSSSSSSVTRHRKRARHCHAPSSQRRARPTHEVLTVVHRMATTLGLVGQQVWSAAFLLGDFVLTHEELFAGMQVR